MKQLHNKGVWNEIKEAVIAALILGVLIYLIWAYILHGIVPTTNTLQQCTALTVNNGVCKAECDSSSEYAFPGIGCKGKANICCVRKNENMNDVLLPTSYGGNKNYDFEVVTMVFGSNLPGNCHIDPNDATFRKTLICQPGSAYTIPVEIFVRNLYTPTDVYADPVVVINGNGNTMRVGKFTGTQKKRLSAVSTGMNDVVTQDNPDVITRVPVETQPDIVTTNIKVLSSESKPNDYWEIYPYVTCDTKECQKTDDPANRGIFNTNNKEMLTISFESSK